MRFVGIGSRLVSGLGVVLLLFGAYALWGTDLRTERSQRELATDFQQGTTSATPTFPGMGEAVARLTMPTLGDRQLYVVRGISVSDLKRGPGHYPDTPLPGQSGNAAIAGHRTTYGAPFHNIDDLEPGDPIIAETVQGRFRYEVIGTEIVAPTKTSVVADQGDDRLTLTACHPKYSARQRIIVSARLVGQVVEPLPGQPAVQAGPGAQPTDLDGFGNEPVLRFPGALWGVAALLAWGIVLLVARRVDRSDRVPTWVPYVAGLPICLVFLFQFFESLSYESLVQELHLPL